MSSIELMDREPGAEAFVATLRKYNLEASQAPNARQQKALRGAQLFKGASGAGEGNRTPDIQLGKLTFYL